MPSPLLCSFHCFFLLLFRFPLEVFRLRFTFRDKMNFNRAEEKNRFGKYLLFFCLFFCEFSKERWMETFLLSSLLLLLLEISCALNGERFVTISQKSINSIESILREGKCNYAVLLLLNLLYFFFFHLLEIYGRFQCEKLVQRIFCALCWHFEIRSQHYIYSTLALPDLYCVCMWKCVCLLP